MFSPGHLGKSAIDEGGLTGGIGNTNRFRSTAEYTVDLGKFRLQTFHRTARQGNTHLPQGNPLLVCQNTGRTTVTGQTAFRRAQNQKMLHLLAPHGIDRTDHHRIQHRRDSSHIILAQKQGEKPQKAFAFPTGIAQNIVHLLHGRQKNLPELIENLRIAVISRGIQFICQVFEPLCHLDGVQEFINRPDLIAEKMALLEGFLQRH